MVTLNLTDEEFDIVRLAVANLLNDDDVKIDSAVLKTLVEKIVVLLKSDPSERNV